MVDKTTLFLLKEAVKYFIKENNLVFKSYRVGYYQNNTGDPVMYAKIFREALPTIEAISTNIEGLTYFLTKSLNEKGLLKQNKSC